MMIPIIRWKAIDGTSVEWWDMNHCFMISAAHKSSGKTTLSVGLCAALQARKITVQPFKKGPDYIDPIWLTQASGRACRNLDLYLMSTQEVASIFQRFAGQAEVALVEGNKGLYDGLALDGSNSNAALAKGLGLPVVLVLDARGMTRGIAPLILGYQAFDPGIRFAGVILNQLGGTRHESKLRRVIEHYTDIPVLGAVHHDSELFVAERHLGLVPGNETPQALALIQQLSERIEQQVDLPALLERTRTTPACVPVQEPQQGLARSGAHPFAQEIFPTPAPPVARKKPLRIAIARDQAFGFYYADDLEALEAAGARLIPFNTLTDRAFPEVDGLYIGGGFPEAFAGALAANEALRSHLRRVLAAGLPAYAECGGLMYLARSLRTLDGKEYPMVGSIPGTVVMHERPVGRGYVHLAEQAHHPWPRPKGPAQHIRAHEFHYSSLEELPSDSRFAYQVCRGYGINGNQDGLVINQLLASYTHLRTIGDCTWANRFVAFIRQQRDASCTVAPMQHSMMGEPVHE